MKFQAHTKYVYNKKNKNLSEPSLVRINRFTAVFVSTLLKIKQTNISEKTRYLERYYQFH